MKQVDDGYTPQEDEKIIYLDLWEERKCILSRSRDDDPYIPYCPSSELLLSLGTSSLRVMIYREKERQTKTSSNSFPQRRLLQNRLDGLSFSSYLYTQRMHTDIPTDIHTYVEIYPFLYLLFYSHKPYKKNGPWFKRRIFPFFRSMYGYVRMQ